MKKEIKSHRKITAFRQKNLQKALIARDPRHLNLKHYGEFIKKETQELQLSATLFAVKQNLSIH